jgi:hypothetical protein
MTKGNYNGDAMIKTEMPQRDHHGTPAQSSEHATGAYSDGSRIA